MKAGASWIFDNIASYQQDDRIHSHSFQLWEFEICFDHWQVKCLNADFDNLLTAKIAYARFPLDEFDIVVKDCTAYLLSEYQADDTSR